ncbi:Uncharacterised protein [Mycobacteroides abscessus subsp. abscessus]|nr:Uncharacterised protein [Mycobacteroides abscessus subsp. abscessus]SIC89089.1 Uncharacterised protein [Mycobacteroides abscessus subsp. abscessus]SID09400.1 Uncharacterised protein [Mycobacteroides abscessus subsp. abscessus]SID54058.1 Uncharacterised protein [Mycobacteroides abscessus subsp. abscessus]SKT54387.1 Uncharacterised protein [Mycobacteroides abscessus subsp. abscessus]
MENIEMIGPRQRLVRPNAPVNPVDANVFRSRDNDARRTIVGHDAISPCAGRAMARLKAPRPAEYAGYLAELKATASAEFEEQWRNHLAGNHGPHSAPR